MSRILFFITVKDNWYLFYKNFKDIILLVLWLLYTVQLIKLKEHYNDK